MSSTLNGVLEAVDRIRRTRGHVTNLFITTDQLESLLDRPGVQVSMDDSLLVICTRDSEVWRGYFYARNLLDLSQLACRLPDPVMPLVVDIIGRTPNVNLTSGYLANHGFDYQSTFVRLSARPYRVIRSTDVKGVRKIRTDELPAVLDIITNEFNHLDAHIPGKDELAEAMHRGEVFGAYGAESLSGVAYFQSIGPRNVVLRYFVVKPEERGKGIGNRILNYVQQTHDPETQTTLWVSTSNPTLSLYRRMGFVSDGLEDHILVKAGGTKMENSISSFLIELRPETDFSASENFIQDGLLDSFDLVSLVSMLEEQFSVFIDALEIVPENFATVDAIASLVSRSVSSA